MSRRCFDQNNQLLFLRVVIQHYHLLINFGLNLKYGIFKPGFKMLYVIGVNFHR